MAMSQFMCMSGREIGEAVFLVEDEVFLRESEGLKVAKPAKAELLAEANRGLIIRSWHEHFDRP